MTDYRLDLKIKNGRLWRAMQEFGYETVADLSRATGICQTLLGKYLNLKQTPYGKNGRPKKTADQLSEHFAMPISDLFPDEFLYRPVEKNTFTSLVSHEQVMRLTGSSSSYQPDEIIEQETDRHNLAMVIESLTEREQMVIRRRFGLNGSGGQTLREIADDFGVTHERIRQIEAKAIRKLRNPSRSELIRPTWAGGL